VIVDSDTRIVLLIGSSVRGIGIFFFFKKLW